MHSLNVIHQPAPQVTRHDFLDADASKPVERVLVVVFLRGAADGLTLVPPTGDDRYYSARPQLAVKKADAIRLNDYFSLNAALRPLMRHYEQGKLAIVHGTGSEDNSRSHFDAQDFMEHGGPDGGGWLARYLRARGPAASALSAVAIGTTLPESLRGAPAGAVMQTIRDFSFTDDNDPNVIDQLAGLYARDVSPLGQAARDTVAAVRKLRELRSGNDLPANGAVYPQTQFGQGLREIARLIKADIGLVTTTIDHSSPLSNWDTHFVQQQVIGSLMTSLAEGIDAFLTDLGEHGRRVTLVTMTEFGRRLRENTSFGTDHGAGSVMFIAGDGAEQWGGGTVRSGWTDLADSNLDDVGDVPARINYRDVLAPVLLRQAPDIDLKRVFPEWRVVQV